MADPTDATKKTDFSVANVSTGQTRHVTFPNIDSVTVGPLTSVASSWVRFIGPDGVQNRSQPAFTDILGSIGSNQNNIPSGKTNYVDATNGNNTTALPSRFDRPYKTLNGGTGALANTSAGDEVNMSPGSFAESGAVVLPANVSFVGAGAGSQRLLQLAE